MDARMAEDEGDAGGDPDAAATPSSLPSSLVEELGALIRGLPPPVLVLALQATVERVSAATRAALAPLVEAGSERVLAAVLGLPRASAEEVGGILLEVAAQVASDSGAFKLPDDDDPPADTSQAPRSPVPSADPASSGPPRSDDDAGDAGESNFEEVLSTLIRGLPPPVLGRALQVAFARLSGAAREALGPFVMGVPDAERLLATVLALPGESGDEVGGLLLDAAAQVASGDDDEAPAAPRPAPRARRRRPPRGGPLVIEAGASFALPAVGKRRARTITVERRLAEGGGGIVWLGRDQDEAPIIVKTGKVSGEVPLSLRVERAVLEPLDHPNLVRLLGSCADAGGNLYLFLELLFPNPVLRLNEPRVRERVTLRAQAPGARYLPPPPAIALDLVHDLLRGLEALHAVGFVHNDVKLSNFLLAVDHRSSEIDDRAYFQALERGEYHGVLIDAGGIRNLETLAEINRGQEDPALPPIELTPVYAPPEALLGRMGDTHERPFYSPAGDVYAAALVAYTTVTGYVPYSHLKVQPRDFPTILEVKRAERRGAVSPLARDRMREARFQDARFADQDRQGHERCRSRFEGALADFLLKRVDPDPAVRGSMPEMRRELEHLFAIRARTRAEFSAAKKIGERGPRLYDQHVFAVSVGDPSSRLVQAAGQAPNTG